jgi:CXXX repeat modification system protein
MATNDKDGDSGRKMGSMGLESKARIIVGSVTTGERDEMRALFERKNGLSELFRSLAGLGESDLKASALYDRLVEDMSENAALSQGWWDRMSRKYSWEALAGYKWEIDFDSCTVYCRRQ